MNFIRWISFWPVAIASGFAAGGVAMLLGDLLFGYWWFTSCLAIVLSVCIQPVVTTVVAANIAPRVNKFTAGSILIPYLPLYLSAAFTLISLIFLGYEGYHRQDSLFSPVSPWWFSLSCNIGWLYGVGLAWELWEEFIERQKAYDEYEEAQVLADHNQPTGGAALAA